MDNAYDWCISWIKYALYFKTDMILNIFFPGHEVVHLLFNWFLVVPRATRGFKSDTKGCTHFLFAILHRPPNLHIFFIKKCSHAPFINVTVVGVIVWQLDLQLPVQPMHITTEVVSSNPTHGEVYSIQHYVIKFVSDLWQVGGFLRVFRFTPPIKLTATIYL